MKKCKLSILAIIVNTWAATILTVVGFEYNPALFLGALGAAMAVFFSYKTLIRSIRSEKHSAILNYLQNR